MRINVISQIKDRRLLDYNDFADFAVFTFFVGYKTVEKDIIIIKHI